MATLSPDDLKIKEYTTNLLKQLPRYIHDYKREKEKNGTSFRTLYQYMIRYKYFFEWLIADTVLDAPTIQDITLKQLENLRKQDIEYFLDHLKEENIATKNEQDADIQRNREVRSVALMISTLKSLFHYLYKVSEDDNGNTYIQKNVMDKIHIPIKRETSGNRAAEISTKIIKGDQMREFVEWIANENGYLETLTTQQSISPFKRDRERDTLILALLLASGIRVGELARIEISDINFGEQTIKIIRKGSKKDVIYVMDYAFEYLLKYIKIRNTCYRLAENCPFLFVSAHKKARPLGIRAIQYLVEKYTGAYFQTGVYPHKLRHSFAVAYIKSGGDISVLRDLLGHSNIETTSLYVNMANSDKVDSLKVMNDGIWG
ncbi:MAG: tyrosine recombinase XerS [Kurthia sp.]|nr:tyrosine recombinase XerS [Candidatus Kurthia equi]